MVDRHAAHSPSLGRRALMSAIAALLLYGNVAVALGPPALLHQGLSLPAPRWLRDAFLMTGMFNSYSERNVDFVLAGLRDDTGDPIDRGRWVRLSLRDHFVQRHGVTFTQLFAAHHWDALGTDAQRAAWASLAAKIRQRHNRKHAEHKVTRVRIAVVDWPISPKGYRARKSPDESVERVWFEESR